MGEIRVKSENLFDENMKQSSVRESSAKGATYETVTSYSTTSRITSTYPQPASGNTISWDDSNFDIGICYFDYVNGETWYTQVFDIWFTSSPYVCRDYPCMSITIRKKDNSDITPSEVKNAKLMLANTALPYQPYFLNLPAHEKTAAGWENIPTHTMTATGWQGELTSQSPLEFRATGQSLLDWRIDGASGGVGDWDETEQKYVIPVTVGGVTTNLYTDAQLMDGDSLDFATDQTSIPITEGDNTLTVGTAVQPKSVFVKFEG